MDYYSIIHSIITYIENRMHEELLDYDDMAMKIGFSHQHMRDTFRKQTGISIGSYFIKRKVLNSIHDLLYTSNNISYIALKFGFASHDVYTRAFIRVMGCRPREFKMNRPFVGKIQLIPGVYGIGINEEPHNIDIYKKREMNETILYGIPKISFKNGEMTMFPLCLTACANYMGVDVDYVDIMVSSGLAFRFNWMKNKWFLGNIDSSFTYDDSYPTAYLKGLNSYGENSELITVSKETSKNEIIQFIKRNIDNGKPCIATGIVGPPEPCIITGYRNNCEILLGWSFFQDDPAYSQNINFHENGYFETDKWWKNGLEVLMTLGDVITHNNGITDVINDAVIVMSGREYDGFAKGIDAYDAWIESLLDESSFSDTSLYTSILDSLLCEYDAINCIKDGRSCIQIYFNKKMKLLNHNDKNEEIVIMHEIAMAAHKVVGYMDKLLKVMHYEGSQEEKAYYCAKKPIRMKLISILREAKKADSKILDNLLMLQMLVQKK